MTPRRTLLALAAFAALLPAGAASAQDSGALRASGVAGETADGFMACRTTCDDQTQAAISQINARRAQVYREAATRTGVTVQAAGAASFQNRLNCTNVPADSCIRSGEYYRPAGGSWTRK